MKDTFLNRLLGRAGVEVAEVEATANEAVTKLQADFDAFKAEAETNLAKSEAALTQAIATIKEADAKVAELTAKLEAMQAEKVAAAKEAEEKRLAARLEKIKAAVGSEKAESLMAATSDLTDDKFEAVVGAMTGAIDAESNSSMFTEQGATGNAAPPQVTDAAAGTLAALKIVQGEDPAL
jgi:hypothetical protein